MREVFESIINKKYSTEELLYSYKKNPNETIGYIYEYHYAEFIAIANRFAGVDTPTKESVILEQIWRALENFKEDSTCKVTTVICTYIKNELRRITQANKMDKRILNECTHTQNFSDYFSVDGDSEVAEDKVFALGTTDTQELEEIELQMYINSLDLNYNQRRFCTALIQGCKPTKSAVAKEIGISRAGANVIVKALQQKLIELIPC